MECGRLVKGGEKEKKAQKVLLKKQKRDKQRARDGVWDTVAAKVDTKDMHQSDLKPLLKEHP